MEPKFMCLTHSKAKTTHWNFDHRTFYCKENGRIMLRRSDLPSALGGGIL